MRCATGDNIFLYDHEASSGVESMNHANKPVRDMAAVDVVVNAIMLLASAEIGWHIIVSLLINETTQSHMIVVCF